MNLAGLRSALHALSPPAEICLVDGFRLGPTAPEHRAVVDGDERSAAIAAASIIAKVVRDRAMRRMDAALSALRLRLARRLHHPGPLGQGARARPVQHPSPLLPGAVLPLRGRSPGARRASHLVAARAAERRARLYYRARGYRILATNVRVGRSEIDLIVRRGSRARLLRGEDALPPGLRRIPFEMVGAKKRRTGFGAPRRSGWPRNPRHGGPADTSFDIIGMHGGRLERFEQRLLVRVGTDTYDFAVYGRGVLGRATTHALVGLEPRRVEVEAHLADGQAGLDDRRAGRPRLPGGEGTRPQRDRLG